MGRSVLCLGLLVLATRCGVKGPPEPPLPSEGSLTKTSTQQNPNEKAPDTATAPGDSSNPKASAQPAGDFKPDKNKKSKKTKAQEKGQ